jgi:hypothetical protein
MSQCFTEDAIPPPERVQLLRTLPQSGHEAGDTQISLARQMVLAVRGLASASRNDEYGR